MIFASMTPILVATSCPLPPQERICSENRCPFTQRGIRNPQITAPIKSAVTCRSGFSREEITVLTTDPLPTRRNRSGARPNGIGWKRPYNQVLRNGKSSSPPPLSSAPTVPAKAITTRTSTAFETKRTLFFNGSPTKRFKMS